MSTNEKTALDESLARFALSLYIVPRHDWLLEVDGIPFDTLTEAEAFSKRNGAPIYCRPIKVRKQMP